MEFIYMQEIVIFFLKDHPTWTAAILLLGVQHLVAKQYPQALLRLTYAFLACTIVSLIYMIGYNQALMDIPYAAKSCTFAASNGEMTKLSEAINHIEGDTNFWFILLLTGLIGAQFFPWLEKHRKEPRV